MDYWTPSQISSSKCLVTDHFQSLPRSRRICTASFSFKVNSVPLHKGLVFLIHSHVNGCSGGDRLSSSAYKIAYPCAFMSSVLSRYRFWFSWTCLSRNRSVGHRQAQCPPFWGLCHCFPKQQPSNVHRFQLLSVLTSAGCWLSFCYSLPSGVEQSHAVFRLLSLSDNDTKHLRVSPVTAYLYLERCSHPNLVAFLPPAPLGTLPPTICSVIFLGSQINNS